ncbi:MAG: 1,4-dihydroxy-2-naphthoate polyprenyltransferase [Gammaproteobacteria bacterium]|nr:1,4-dihydroxy-2-naphthoate polyprenyltransferase [Gammaproteobacteria bacterium]
MKPTTAQAWILAARPQTLTISVAPVLLGAALASEVGTLSIPVLVAAMIGAICIQIGTNLYNDYADFNKGADGTDRLGPPRACANGWLPPRQVFAAVGITFAVAMAAGAYLVAVAGWPILIIGVASLACGIAYTGGPWPLAYVGIADLFVFVFFGLVAVGGTYFVLAGSLSIAAVLGGAILGCLATAVLAVNNLRDRAGDGNAGKRTLAVRYGEAFARGQYAFLISCSALLVVLVALFVPGAGIGWLAPLALAPWLVQLVRDAFRLDGHELNGLLKKTAIAELAFSILLSAGIVLT